MNRYVLASLVLALLAIAPTSLQQSDIKVASKKFTESVILGEIVSQQIAATGVGVKHYQELGGTRVAYNALIDGEIDLYPEYTGTILEEILSDRNVQDDQGIAAALSESGLVLSRPLGFNNTYAIAVTRETADRLDVKDLSDLGRYPDLRFGLTNEFLDRGDGWKSLTAHYGFRFKSVKGLDHDLAYRQLLLGSIDVMDVYSTDAKIDESDLVILEDDRSFFPRYDAVLLYRDDLRTRFPAVVSEITRLEGLLDEQSMIELNHRVEIGGQTDSEVASEFLKERLGIETDVSSQSLVSTVVSSTIEHLNLVRRSLIPAIFVGILLGILAFKRARLGGVILASVEVIQTIPSLALLVMLMPLVALAGAQSIGTGSLTAVLALFLYSLLPIVRGTYTGLAGISRGYAESAEAMGLSGSFKLLNVQLPLAARSILSGVRTATVLNIGFATLGALIGAGGYGQPILTGIRLADTSLILQGAVPAAALALFAQWGFNGLERRLIPESSESA